MAIEKEKFFEIIRNVSESKDLNEDNLLQKIKDELHKKDYAEYDKFKRNFGKEHQFSIKISDKIENWTLLHLAVACDNKLTVKLLLKKKASVKTRVKDGSNDGRTALGIAISNNDQEIIQLLRKANPQLEKNKDKTPEGLVVNGNNAAAEPANVISPYLKQHDATRNDKQTSVTGESSDSTVVEQYPCVSVKSRIEEIESPKKPNATRNDKQTSVTGESSDSTVVEQYPCVSVKSRIEEIESPKKPNATRNDKQTSVTGESSESTVDEQYPCVSVKSRIEEIESPKKPNATRNDKQTSVAGESSDSTVDEQYPCVSVKSRIEEIEPPKKPNATRNDKQTSVAGESSDSTVDEQYPCVSVKSRIEEIEPPKKPNATYSDKRILTDESDSEDSGLELGLETASNTSSHSKINHDGANHVEKNVDNQTLENALRSQKEENQSLKQKIQDLGNENTKLKDKLDKTESQYSKAEALLEKTQKELEESKSCIAGHETKLKEFNKENESLRQEIKNLKNENTPLKSELGKTKTNEVSLEKVGKRQFSPKVAYASLAAMLVVGAALSIASGLSALLIVAASVVSALIAGGITYTISRPIAEPKPTTELKEVNIQGSAQHGVCKT
ncbi:ankyrin repeat domain-containing protein [Wolbachia endosymbiont (group A) of Sicus ferrugineus]|uniref:ankyrin repeat domain-containing protein n=1 Tax=Wolbachia endosymbiont (group A) of Sicus ferrugineus TaxID=2954056 RepID=UPI00222E6498|nr:ankyrin repeat domain-containing protein [Wolbachia endosymbiont (group A) of Sicus ferrugineus]